MPEAAQDDSVAETSAVPGPAPGESGTELEPTAAMEPLEELDSALSEPTQASVNGDGVAPSADPSRDASIPPPPPPTPAQQPRPTVSPLTSTLLYMGYFAWLLIALNVLRVDCSPPLAPLTNSTDVSNSTSGVGECPGSGQCRAIFTGAPLEHPKTILYMARWTPFFASLTVLFFGLLLVRIIAVLSRRVASLESQVKGLEEELGYEEEQEEVGGGEGGEAEGLRSATETPKVKGKTSAKDRALADALSQLEVLKGAPAPDSTMLAILKHDIRAPLKGSLGLLQLLLGSSLDPMQQDFVHSAQANARSIVHVINNVLDAATFEEAPQKQKQGSSAHESAEDNTGEAEGTPPHLPSIFRLDAAVFELRSIVDEVLAIFGSEACEKGLEIASLVMDSVPSAAVGDPLRLRQVLMNLFSVAVHLTEAGHVFLCVRLAADETELKLLGKQISRLGKSTAGPKAAGSAANKSRLQEGPSPTVSYSPSGETPARERDAAGAAVQNGAVGEEEREQGGLKEREGSTGSGQGEGSERSPAESHAVRAGRGKSVLAKGESLTLSGRATADDSNSWHSICGMLREQEERFQRLMKSESGAGKGGEGGQGKVRLVFTLEDTGTGLPDAVIERMDSPFRPLPPELQARYAGVPLYLFIAQKWIEALGGQMLVLSRPGTGTTITFDITLSQTTKLPGSTLGRVHHLGTGPIGDELHPELAASRAKLRGLRCLVVDGRPVRQQVTSTYMARLGLRVDLSDSVPAAALALRHGRNVPGTGLVNKKSRWDIVVVDADADGPNTGVELGRMVQQLRDLVEPWEKAPVLPKLVLVAQSTNEEMEAEAGKHGFSCIMLKPLRATSMATALLQALGLNPSETTAMALRRRQILLRLCLKSKKVMVVDHVFMTRKAAAVELSRFADACLAVETGQDALRRLEPPHDFHLILVNMRLADMSGPAFVDRVRMMEAEEYRRETQRKGNTVRLQRVPILGMVSEGAGDAIARWRELDIDGLVTSPLEEAQIFGLITKIFREPER